MRDDDTPDSRDNLGPVPDRSDDATSTGPIPGGGGLPAIPRPRSRASSAGRQLAGRLSELTSLGRPGVARWAPLASPRGRRRARLVVASGVVCCLGLTAFAQARDETAHVVARVDPLAAQSELVQRAQAERASRAQERTSPDPATTSAAPTATGAAPTGRAVPDPDTAPAPTATRPGPVDPGPVAGLSVAQMDNAKAIVRTGRDLGMPRRALVIAVATAMQESNLYNVASGVVPESRKHPHQGIGWDHDSVGLFQQRASTGWGPVDKLMDPAYATTRFLEALRQVPGWERMRLTEAAQAVQVSAYPEHYAKHESRAVQVVDAIVPGWK